MSFIVVNSIIQLFLVQSDALSFYVVRNVWVLQRETYQPIYKYLFFFFFCNLLSVVPVPDLNKALC